MSKMLNDVSLTLLEDVCHELGNIMTLPVYLRSEQEVYGEKINNEDFEKMGRRLYEFLPKYEQFMTKYISEVVNLAARDC